MSVKHNNMSQGQCSSLSNSQGFDLRYFTLIIYLTNIIRNNL